MRYWREAQRNCDLILIGILSTLAKPVYDEIDSENSDNINVDHVSDDMVMLNTEEREILCGSEIKSTDENRLIDNIR